MLFLVDASLPRKAADMLHLLGHHAVDVRDIAMGSATDEVIAARAQATRYKLITPDYDFADIRNYPPEDYSGIVVLQLPEHATATQVVDPLQSLVERDDWLARLSGRLAIVESHRVRFRPA